MRLCSESDYWGLDEWVPVTQPDRCLQACLALPVCLPAPARLETKRSPWLYAPLARDGGEATMREA